MQNIQGVVLRAHLTDLEFYLNSDSSLGFQFGLVLGL